MWEVRVFPPREGQPGIVEALTYQQSLPPIYQRVYPEPGMVVPRLKRDLNAFLGTWLRNLKAQGHRGSNSMPTTPAEGSPLKPRAAGL